MPSKRKKDSKKKPADWRSQRFLWAAISGAIAVVIIALAVVGLGGENNSDGTLPESTLPEPTLPNPGLISPSVYEQQFVESGVDHYLLDVRTIEEFDSGHIAGAANIPVEILDRYLADVPADVPVVVYCRTGRRSAEAATILRNAGYTEVYDLDKGIQEWLAQGYPVE